ncbi:MAG: PAS domain S-box protein [Deltaproteobacteria bacterium]|nr:PAS domain S-box protein [Deltaproteobacteria bacterium]
MPPIEASMIRAFAPPVGRYCLPRILLLGFVLAMGSLPSSAGLAAESQEWAKATQPPSATASPSSAALTTAVAVRALTPERAEQALPVRIRGVITCAGSLTFIQDHTAGIFVDVPVSHKGRYHVGEYGDLEGFTAPGLFAPQIVPARFTVLGTAPLPPARVAKFDELSAGKLDSQRVEVEGIVRAILPDERPDLRRTVTLKMASDDGVFAVSVSDLPPEKLRSVTDASVRVRGVVGGVFNERRQMIGIKLYVGRADDLIVQQPGRSHSSAIPITPVDRLLRFQPEGQSRHRVRIVGTVTLVHPGVELCVEDGTGGVMVLSRQVDTLAVGDRVDVLGFPQMGSWTPFLDDAVFRRDGVAPDPVVPISVTVDQELSSGSHDSRLVRLDAELVDVVADAGRLLLVAKTKKIVFDAELSRLAEMNHGRPGSAANSDTLAGTAVPSLAFPVGLRNGSQVRLTGISVVRLGDDREHPSHFRLLLRTLDDVVVLQKPPWLTLGRLIWILVALAVFTALVLGWGVVLRRRIRLQTVVMRQQLQNESHLEARYRDLFDNATDVIYTHDPAGRFLTVNRAAESLTGYSREELLQRTIFDLTLPARRNAVSAWLKRASSGNENEMPATLESELVAKDGRFVPVEISVRAIVQGNQVTAIEGVARDITERKRADAELAAAHQRLIETSRRAGISEVAASVLRSVGNVSTSVTASAMHLADQLRGSKLPHVASVVETLREHAADSEGFARFLIDDPRGRQLPSELAGLVEHLARERLAMAREVESLGRSVEHIQEIVAMQQGYARLSGVREDIAAEVLIEDALRIQHDALERRQVTVVRDFSPAPLLFIEKHRVLAILVNLLGNAQRACDQRPDGTLARIKVRVDTPKGERAGERVRIVVADNGMGIAHEHLTRVFDSGFIPHADGRGGGGLGEFGEFGEFGLHSAWTTARELGGSLFVHSDGVGKGARFTLDLPVRPSDAEAR